jgi:hypothetical protein
VLVPTKPRIRYGYYLRVKFHVHTHTCQIGYPQIKLTSLSVAVKLHLFCRAWWPTCANKTKGHFFGSGVVKKVGILATIFLSSFQIVVCVCSRHEHGEGRDIPVVLQEVTSELFAAKVIRKAPVFVRSFSSDARTCICVEGN